MRTIDEKLDLLLEIMGQKTYDDSDVFSVLESIHEDLRSQKLEFNELNNKYDRIEERLNSIERSLEG